MQFSEHSFSQIRDKGGDDRLDKMRKSPQILLIFWVSHLSWCLIVSLPVTLFNLVVYTNPSIDEQIRMAFCIEPNQPMIASNIEILGLLIWIFGLLLSSIADIEKLLHYEFESKRGKITSFCSAGVWSWSRNPNFAGEIILWLGMAIMSSYNLYVNPILQTADSIYRWWIIGVPYLSPLFTAFVLIGWSGVPFRERKYWKMFGNQHKEYMEYRERTSIIWPLPPGLYPLIPQMLKRTVFCEWDMFAWKSKVERSHGKTR